MCIRDRYGWYGYQDNGAASSYWEKSNDGGSNWTTATASGSIGLSHWSDGNTKFTNFSAFTLDISDESYEYRIRDS